MTNLASNLAKQQRAKAERTVRADAARLVQARNRCILALAELPEPAEALQVIEAISRSIREYIAIQARG